MSLVHFVPDTTVVPCLGCNELIAPQDLVKHKPLSGPSTLFWYPYHLWCWRESARLPSLGRSCAECDAALDVEDMRAIVTWGATAWRRAKRRMLRATPGPPIVHDQPDAFLPRPRALRLVVVDVLGFRDPTLRGPRPELTDNLFAEDELDPYIERRVRIEFEMVHDLCPSYAADAWLARLRAAPDDDELRKSYAQWLEQAGEPTRARFVRLALSQRRGAHDLRRELGDLRRELPGGWVRDVCKKSALALWQQTTRRCRPYPWVLGRRGASPLGMPLAASPSYGLFEFFLCNAPPPLVFYLHATPPRTPRAGLLVAAPQVGPRAGWRHRESLGPHLSHEKVKP